MPTAVTKKCPKASTSRQRLWTAMRIRRRFTVGDMVEATNCSTSFVEGRLEDWHRFGIVFPDNDGWRLAKDLGPLPPWGSHNARAMIDRNSGKPLDRLKIKRRGAKRPDVALRNAERRARQAAAIASPSRRWMTPEKSAVVLHDRKVSS